MRIVKIISLNFFLGSILFISSVFLFGADDFVKFKVGGGVSYEYGYLLYNIGEWLTIPGKGTYSLPTVISQLKFPVSTPLIGINFDVAFFEKSIISLKIKKNIPYVNGKLEDSDWAYWDLRKYTLDIFSQSDAVLDLYKGELSFKQKIPVNSFFFFGGNFALRYAYIYYNIYNLDQWYPSSKNNNVHDKINGLILTYQVQKTEFLIGGFGGFQWDRYQIELGINGVLGGISDLDNHKLRNKYSKGSLSLVGLDGGLDFTWKFHEHWNLCIGLQGEYNTASGTQSQYYETSSGTDSGKIGDIKETWESAVISGGMNIQYLF